MYIFYSFITRWNSYNPYDLWIKFCGWYLKSISAQFHTLGELICRKPWGTFVILHLLLLLLACGFTQFQFANRWEELYVPQGSQAFKDLRKADAYFNIDNREEIVILVPKYPNSAGILTTECFQDALKIHNAIVEQKNYVKFCETLTKKQARNVSECVTVNPLELFNYGRNGFGKLLPFLSMHMHSREVMSNGRSVIYNLYQIFGTTFQVDPNLGFVKHAGALMMRYFLRYPRNDATLNDVLSLEARIINTLTDMKTRMKHVKISYASTRSVDDAIGESTGSDVRLVSVTFILMISFACFVSGNIRESARSHSLLSLFGIVAVVYGIATGLGLGMWLQLPFISMVGTLPFLVLGVGLDNMFLIIHELDRTPLDWPVTKRIAHALSQTGPTVTMTSVTNVVAFAVSTLTQFPAIRIFCIYASLCIAFAYFFVVTFFVTAAKFDADRIKAGKIDVLLCRYSGRFSRASEYLKFDRLPHFSSVELMRKWTSFILKFPMKQIFIIVAVGLFSMGCYGAFNIDQRFDHHVVAKQDSYFMDFIRTSESYYSQSVEVSLVVEGNNLDYSSSTTQEELLKLEKIAFANKFYISNQSVFWLSEFKVWADYRRYNHTGPDFYRNLKHFLRKRPFKQDIVFDRNQRKIIASRILVYTISTTDSLQLRDAMKTLRQDIKRESRLPAFPISKQYLHYEQYDLTTKETIRNLLIAAIAILLVSSVYLAHPIVILFVFLSFASLVVELFGLMYIWNVSLNGISMVGLMMAIGYSVDYSAHVAHAFVVSDMVITDERVVRALSTVGISVLMGGKVCSDLSRQKYYFTLVHFLPPLYYQYHSKTRSYKPYLSTSHLTRQIILANFDCKESFTSMILCLSFIAMAHVLHSKEY